ncbi:hypothetical protein CPB85DRAFT_1253107 [Mucidula mucida]|nr:hypothetical protein CPB85DRAFT_1253107 [Mucidula mucida]
MTCLVTQSRKITNIFKRINNSKQLKLRRDNWLPTTSRQSTKTIRGCYWLLYGHPPDRFDSRPLLFSDKPYKEQRGWQYYRRTRHLPPSVDNVDRYIEIRLMGLKADPSSFRTVYEDALKIPREEHVRRLNDPYVFTMIAKDDGTGEWAADAVKSEGTRAFGLAGRLVQCGLEWVKEYPLGEDGKCLVVDVYSENEAAKSVYTKMGFREKHVYTEEG